MTTTQRIFKALKQIGVILLVSILSVMKYLLHGPTAFPETEKYTPLYIPSTDYPIMSE